MPRSPASRIELDVPLPDVTQLSGRQSELLLELAYAPLRASIHFPGMTSSQAFDVLNEGWLTARAEFPGFRIWKISEPKTGEV